MATTTRTPKRPTDESSAEYYGWLWDRADEDVPASMRVGGPNTLCNFPTCLNSSRDEYVAHMLQVVQAGVDYRAKSAARKAALEAAKADVVQQAHAAGKADAEAKARHHEAVQYVATYTGTWGLPLDTGPDTRWGTKYLRLSERQVDALLTGKARDAARAEATQLAQETYADAQYALHMTQQAAAPVQAPARVTQDGMYRTPDGTIYKVQLAVNGSGYLYAKRLVVADGTGTFEYAPGAMRQLDASMQMTLDEAKAFGQLYGVCCKCGRTLTDEYSIANGIGPVCSGKGWRED